MTDAVNLSEAILRDIQARLKDALDNAARDRTLAHRAIERVDQFEARLDTVAADILVMRADIRAIRSDIAAIDIKLAVLPNIEISLRELLTSRGEP
jgi:predicted component of type VI protein secretion system